MEEREQRFMAGRFMRRWMVAVTAGEALGFVIPASVGGLLALTSAPGAVVYPAMVVAGACEGILLGYGQYVGFGRSTVPRVRWLAATGAGAAVAWSIGMLPSTLPDFDPFSSSAVPWMISGALLLLASIPTLQWLVLRRVARRSLRWIPINAGAWAAGLLWTFVPSPFVDEKTAFPVLLACYAVAGVLMAATVAALTGPAAQRIANSVVAGGEPRVRTGSG
jgi:hypothetical protein